MDNVYYGQRLAEIRSRLGLSQRALAKKVSRSQGYISDIEKGRATPSFDFLVKLWEAVGVDPSTIITGSDSVADAPRPFFTPRDVMDKLAVELSQPLAGDLRVGDTDYHRVEADRSLMDPASGSAGFLLQTMMVEDGWLRSRGIAKDSLKLEEVQTEHMTPTLALGSLAIVDRSSVRVDRPSIYLFQLKDELMFGRLRRVEHDEMEVIAGAFDNPSCKPFVLAGEAELESFKCYGRAVASFSEMIEESYV